MTAQSEFEEAPYMGYLFVGNFLGALLASYGIYRRQLWGWLLGLFVAAGSVAGYIWSRTSGMPGMAVEEWFSPYGIVAISIEGIFILIFLLRPWTITESEQSLSTTQQAYHYASPVIGVILLVLISVFAYRWDAKMTMAYGSHVVSLEKVLDSPETSFSELEDQYGVQVSLVASSMLNSIVDVRLKIIDPDKAHTLLINQAALLVNQQSLVLAPHMHSHNGTRLKAGKVFIIFFPTQQLIHTGSEISLVFGNSRVEPVVVR
jgi:hypothetical protein